ncbi:hypothetical protein B5M09_011725 [Aphanomyces astaci]|uniref:Uncharacterized protein n=1 Tax=Aphanomyces astaci TaxID=112090 RepID=A0A3R8DCE8_APHAT|nr:hypothetical protein B5M09_011725 [Aphanomyces astaci]
MKKSCPGSRKMRSGFSKFAAERTTCESILAEQNRYEQTLLSEQGCRQDLEQLVQEKFMTLTQERAQSGEDPSSLARNQLKWERHTNEEVLCQIEQARTRLETEKLQLRGQGATLFRERSVQGLTLSLVYAELERQRAQLQVEQRAVELQQKTLRKTNNAPFATYGTPALSRMGSPSKGSGVTHTTFTMAPLLPVTRSNTPTHRRAFDQTCFMQQTEASPRMSPTFTVRDAMPLQFVPTASIMPQLNRNTDSYPASGDYGQLVGVEYAQFSPSDTGSGYNPPPSYGPESGGGGLQSRGGYGGGHSGRTNPPAPPGSGPNGGHYGGPSAAEVTLRDLLEDPDMEDDQRTPRRCRVPPASLCTIESSLDYLIERDVDIDRRTEDSYMIEDTSPGNSATIEPWTAPGLGDDTKNGMASRPPQTKGVPDSAYKDMQQEGGLQQRPEDKLQTEATMLPPSDERHGPGAQPRPDLSRKTAP